MRPQEPGWTTNLLPVLREQFFRMQPPGPLSIPALRQV
jgi:hypothetical protein